MPKDETLSNTPSDLTELAKHITAGPGWIVIRPIPSDQETLSPGGIVLPQDKSKNPKICSLAYVVSCGEWISKRSGQSRPGCGPGWLSTGQVIAYIPANNWGAPNQPDLDVIYSDDVLYTIRKPR